MMPQIILFTAIDDKWNNYREEVRVGIAYYAGDFGGGKYEAFWDYGLSTIKEHRSNSFADVLAKYIEWKGYADYCRGEE